MRLDAMEKSQQEILSLLRAQTARGAPMRRNQFEDPVPNQLTNVTDQ